MRQISKAPRDETASISIHAVDVIYTIDISPRNYSCRLPYAGSNRTVSSCHKYVLLQDGSVLSSCVHV